MGIPGIGAHRHRHAGHEDAKVEKSLFVIFTARGHGNTGMYVADQVWDFIIWSFVLEAFESHTGCARFNIIT